MGLRIGHYRLIWPAQELQRQGYDVEIVMPGDPSGLFAIRDGDRLRSVQVGRDADVYVFQRPTNVFLVQLMEHLINEGKTVVVDMDDDLTCIHPDNAAFAMLHPARSPKNNWHHAQRACRLATLVTVSTPELQTRFGKERSRVLRNCVPRRFTELERPLRDERIWGWPGAVHSHPDDVPILAGAVQQLRDNFLVVGYPEGMGKALGLPEDPRATGRVEFQYWSQGLLNLDVGAAPLADSRFNRGKSYLKPLELASVGCPWVASDIGEYRVLHNLCPEAGVLVDQRTRSWVKALKRFLTDDSAWQETSEAARSIARLLTFEEHAWHWAETWQLAHEVTQRVNARRAKVS